VVPSVIVHGGAGSVAPERRDSHVAGCERAVAAALATLAVRVGGTGGAIVLDRHGRPGRANNTETMTWAWGAADGARESGW
jgi:isoaspartyl peptidase/L-asparaginase-like protein (Ntn-hydrolase superfamily)